MNVVKDLANAITWLIPGGVVFRVMYCMLQAGQNEDEGSAYRRRAKHAVIYGVIAECIWQVKDIIVAYYK